MTDAVDRLTTALADRELRLGRQPTALRLAGDETYDVLRFAGIVQRQDMQVVETGRAAALRH